MFLKKVVLTGFKSFADKTEFEFGPGITAIVGPNGCGKSNIVDAVKWVLGEQSAKGLRGRSMSDMIFGGSGTRKASGLAQTDLVFDNSDGRLATDQAEVTVSRRLYGSGESEYLLNLQACRLKDIRELFLDTGVGVGAYSIIEQGKVDILLQANPLERRTVFEEAAGISKYKLRKKEALRKLERTEQNLLRVQDVIDEVSRRVRSVKHQAGKARHFQTYHSRLQELRSNYSMAEYHRMSELVAQLAAQAERLGDRVLGVKSAIAAAEAGTSQIGVELLRLEEQISLLDNGLVTVESEITAHQERIAQSRQRTAEQRDVLARAEERAASHRREVAGLEEQVRGREADLRAVEQASAATGTEIERLSEEERRLALAQAQAEAELDERKTAVIEQMRQQARLNNELAVCASRAESLSAQRERLRQRNEGLSRELEEKQGDHERLRGREAELGERIEGESRALEAAKERMAQIRDALDEHARELAEAKEHRSALFSEYQLLADMERRREGISAGVRQLLERREAAPGEHDYLQGIVADLVETNVEHAPLIELALGERDQYLVVGDSGRFLAEVAELGEEAGRVSAFCLDRLPPFMDGRDFTSQPGYVTTAFDLVRCPERYEQLVRHLLGKVIVVETAADAMRLSEVVPVGYRYLTRAGQIVEPDGSVSAGRAGSRTGLISRKSELRSLAERLADVESRIALLEDQRQQRSAEAADAERVQQEQRARVYELQAARIEASAQLESLRESMRRLDDERPLLAGEIQLVDEQVRETESRATKHQAELAALNASHEKLAGEVDELIAQVARLTQQRRGVGEQLTEARVQAGRLREQHVAACASLNALRQRCLEAAGSADSAAREADACRQRIEEAEHTAVEAGARLEELIRQRERISREAAQLRRQREGLRLRAEELAAEIKTHRSQLEELEGSLHEAQVELEGVRTRREDLAARVRDELGIDLAGRYEDYKHEEQDWAAIENEIAELKEKINRLGNVNLDAISELEELELREKFLTAQRDDLNDSRRQLESLIEELNAVSIERFLTTFEQSRIHFQELFRKLFGGGKANFLLEDPSQPLESGVEIIAQPPGKELQSITLLSGGEKTMTAIALLLAIFKSKPSPFAILDEVDAAMDEANNDRFNRIVREFATRSQFVLITHSKRTMTIASRLYGVTMQEAGVSKRVSVRFEDFSLDETQMKAAPAAVA